MWMASIDYMRELNLFVRLSLLFTRYYPFTLFRFISFVHSSLTEFFIKNKFISSKSWHVIWLKKNHSRFAFAVKQTKLAGI